MEGTTPSTGAEVIYQLDDEDIEEYDITPIDIPMFYRILRRNICSKPS